MLKVFFINIWKHSAIRFYLLNLMWNYKFWMYAKKIYKTKEYKIDAGNYEMDFDYTLLKRKKTVSYKRFVGYFFNNSIYLDNPGFQIDDRKTWEAWKRKKLIR